jgi:transcriptional regulator with XRE-family HTH domain
MKTDKNSTHENDTKNPASTKGKRIRALRIQRGLRQEQLAQLIHVSKQTMYKYEFDIVTNIPSDKIETIAKVLNVSPAYIMGWTRSTSPSTLIQNHFSEPEAIFKYNQLDQYGKLVVDTVLNLEYERCHTSSGEIINDLDLEDVDPDL